MPTKLKLGDLTVELVLKDIKNVHLSVYPPSGRVRISAPLRMSEATIRAFAATKIPWIREQQRRLNNQERETDREYLNRESHFVFGKRYLMKLAEADRPASVELKHRHLVLTVRPGTQPALRKSILDDWYRQILREEATPIIAKWQPILGVKVNRVFVQQMKTRWGSCNHRVGSIRLNTELAKKPRECLDYLLLHEMLHLIEPTHNARFIGLLDRFMPRWQSLRALLNRLPLRHEEWDH